MVNTKVTLCGLELSNPLIPASGTFGYGYEFAELYDINVLGSFSWKGTTADMRLGNPQPRIAEMTGGMLNAVGLQNPGVDHVIAHELPEMKEFFHKPVMANVSGFSIEQYVKTCEKLDKEEQVGWLEVNVSCPNVHGGGMSFGTSPEAAAEVVKAVKKVTTKPVIIKLSPNVTDIVAIAKACEDAGADGIILKSGELLTNWDVQSVMNGKRMVFNQPILEKILQRFRQSVINENKRTEALIDYDIEVTARILIDSLYTETPAAQKRSAK